MSLTTISDHVARALARMAQQFKSPDNSTNLEKIVAALVGPAQALEDALWQLYVERRIDSAIGVQLDQIGDIVGLPRAGLDDDIYRRHLRAKTRVNRSTGTLDDVLTVARLVVPDLTYTIEAVYEPPAAGAVRVFGAVLPAGVADALITFLRRTVSGGVRIVLEVLEAPPEDTFTWDGTNDQAWDNGALATALD